MNYRVGLTIRFIGSWWVSAWRCRQSWHGAPNRWSTLVRVKSKHLVQKNQDWTLNGGEQWPDNQNRWRSTKKSFIASYRLNCDPPTQHNARDTRCSIIGISGLPWGEHPSCVKQSQYLKIVLVYYLHMEKHVYNIVLGNEIPILYSTRPPTVAEMNNPDSIHHLLMGWYLEHRWGSFVTPFVPVLYYRVVLAKTSLWAETWAMTRLGSMFVWSTRRHE